ncbi:MAG: carboxypeptidase-like regulatory domain-containing protein [Gemmatimonadales bacterium]
MMTMTGRCTTRVRAKGPVAQLPPPPVLRSGVGGVIGTLSDSGGALPHYTILAEMPGNAPSSPHASTIADSLGGFVFNALTPGRYRLSVRAFAHRPDSTDIDVIAGQVDTVHFSPPVFRCVR